MAGSDISGVLYKPKADVVASDLGGHWALLDLSSSMYFTVNEAGAEVWQALQAAPATLDTLVNAVTETFDVEADVCRPDIEALVNDLSTAGLIEAVSNTADA